MQTTDWLFVTLVFAAIVSGVWALNAGWTQWFDPRSRVLADRLKQAPQPGVASPGLRLNRKRMLSTLPVLDRWLQKIPGMAAFDGFLLQTGLPIAVGQTLMIAGVLVLAGLVAGAWFGWPTGITGLMAVACLLAGAGYLQHRRQQRIVQIEQQMPDVLDLIARSMQAGHAFTSALRIAADDTRPPLAGELRTVFDEINFGIPTTRALQAMSQRVVSEDVRFFVVAVVIQNETGGNLAEILKKTAALIRERQKIAGVVRVLSAEGRISAVILSLLPFALAGTLNLINPEFMAVLWTDPMGLKMVWFSLALMTTGMFWMWKMVQIRV